MKRIDFKEAVEILRDDEQYYGEYGSQFLHNSNIMSLLNDPQSFRVHEDSVAMLYGRLFHEMVMFNKFDTEVVNASTRSTKIYKETSAEHGGQILLLQKEADQLMMNVEKAKSNSVFRDVMEQVIEFELPGVKVLNEKDELDDEEELIWAAKADIITEDYVYDLKTTSSIASFGKSARVYNYDSQAYIYTSMFDKPMRFLVVEKGTGNVALFETSTDAYMRGEQKVEDAESAYRRYFGEGKTLPTTEFVHYGRI